MTFITSYKKLYCQEAKRNLFLTGIGILSLFIALPLYFLQQISTTEGNYGVRFQNISGDMIREKYNVLYNVTYGNYFLVAVTAFLAVLNGIVLFSYLSSRKKQDFYFGQPMSRGTLFRMYIILGISNIVIPSLINGVLVLLVAGLHSSLYLAFVTMLIQSTLVNCLLYLSVFALTVLAAVLTGKLIFSVLGTAVFLFYFPACFIVLDSMFHYRLYSLSIPLSNIYLFSPITIGMQLYRKISRSFWFIDNPELQVYHYETLLVVALGIIFIVALALAWMLYQKRRSEETGKSLVFKATKGVIKAFLVAFAAIGTSVLFVKNLGEVDKTYWLAGATIGTLAGIYLIDVMLEQSWRASFKKWKVQWIYVLVSLSVFSGILWQKESLRYHGFDDIPKNYTVEQAIKDKCVIEKNEKISNGKDVWDAFYDKVKNGEEAKVRIVHLTDWKGMFHYIDLVYKDNTITRYNSFSPYDKTVETMYLLKLTGKMSEQEKTKSYYVFSERKDMTFEQYRKSVKEDDYVLNFNYWCFLEAEEE